MTLRPGHNKTLKRSFTERHTHYKKRELVLTTHPAGTDSLVPTTPHVGKSHQVFSLLSIPSNNSRQSASVQHFSTCIFKKKIPKQHMHVQYHFTSGVTDRLSDLMQFSKLRVNQSYGPLPSNLCPIKQEDNDPKTLQYIRMQCIRMSTNLFTLQPNKAKKLSMLPITLRVPIKTLSINK